MIDGLTRCPCAESVAHIIQFATAEGPWSRLVTPDLNRFTLAVMWRRVVEVYDPDGEWVLGANHDMPEIIVVKVVVLNSGTMDSHQSFQRLDPGLW